MSRGKPKANYLLKTFKNIDSLYGIDINLEESIHNEKSHYINNYEEIKGKKFDFILLMDVIEHIEDDYEFIKDIKQYLKPNGIILITVPAFQFVYGIHDKELSHYRRYNFKQLKKVLETNEIYVKKWNYFYLSLLLVRIFTKNKSLKVNTWKEEENSNKTRLIRFILNLDYSILKALSKVHIHIGGLSLIAICNIKNK